MTYPALRMKFALSANDGGAWGEDPDIDPTRVLRSTEITLDGLIDPSAAALRTLTSRELKATRLSVGDILVVKSSGSDVHLGKSGWVDERCAGMSFSNFIQRLRMSHTFSPRFAWYFMNCAAMKEQVRILSSTSTGLQNLSGSLIREIEIPAPSVDEQRRIANFLDAETARIDLLASAIAKGADLLQARRKAVLMSAFPRQSNGVRLGYFLDLVTSGPRGWGDYVGDEGAPFFRSANLRRDSIDPNLDDLALVEPPLSAAAEAARSRVRVGDVLVGITGANTGWVSLADQRIERANVSQHVCLVRPGKRVEGRWLAYALSAPQVQELLLGSQYGGTKTQLSLGDIRDLIVPLPPVEEQRRIVADINDGLAAITAEHALRHVQLAVLAERRQALITAAVTGEITV